MSVLVAKRILAGEDPLQSEAAALARAYLEALDLLDRVIEAGIERWHTTENDESQLHAWLGMTWDEYKAHVEDPAIAFLAEHEPVAE